MMGMGQLIAKAAAGSIVARASLSLKHCADDRQGTVLMLMRHFEPKWLRARTTYYYYYY
jgi:hypothetical protein